MNSGLPKSSATLRFRISGPAEAKLRQGHPWLFADSILEQNREGRPGELGVVYDRKDRFLAVGLFDPLSPIRLRVVHTGKPQPIGIEWWGQRLRQAVAKRQAAFDERTTGFRWVNGESDGFPGLVLDRYGSAAVLKLYTAAWLPRLRSVLELVQAQLAPERVVLRLSRNIQTLAQEQFQAADGQILFGQPLEGPLIFQETGLGFETDVVRGQKTGFFLDQRENRRQVERMAEGREVLNAFSFSGAFSVYAARGGARSVLDLDISGHALEAAARNFARNFARGTKCGCRQQGIQADAFEWLANSSKQLFDLVILDPPALAKRQEERAGALRAYGRLARLGLARLRAGGILLACSCSAQVSSSDFFGVLRKAAALSKRRTVELGTAGHAVDHPAAFPEAEYLKAIYLKVSGD
jgi:23S rRNA (cytosine1962-C5)-methyltransferase